MTILFLGPETSPLIAWLKAHESNVVHTDQKISDDYIRVNNVSFIVSFGYRHKISKLVLEAVSGRAVNLHISYLPWNRGADPNFWSFMEDTPKGVTVHFIDEGLDTGDIIGQRAVDFDLYAETLSTSYSRLHREVEGLFKELWSSIKGGTCKRGRQVGAGSHHVSRDKQELAWLLINGWDTPVSVLCEYSARSPTHECHPNKVDRVSD